MSFWLQLGSALGVMMALPAFGEAQAEECRAPRLGVESTIPISGARDIPTNVLIRGRYPTGYLDEYGGEIALYDAGGEPVEGEVVRASSRMLYFIPREALDPSSEYRAIFSGVDGDFEASFVTTDRIDESAPTAPIIVRTEAQRSETRCGSELGPRPEVDEDEGGLEVESGLIRIGLVFETADDDTSISSLEYLLYRTRGPELEAPRLIARASQTVFAGETQTIGAILTEAEADGESCFVLIVEDALLRRTVSEPECFGPKAPHHAFDSLCAAVDLRGTASLFLPILGGLALVWLRRRAAGPIG